MEVTVAGGSRQGTRRPEQTRAAMSAGFTSGELFGIENPAGHHPGFCPTFWVNATRIPDPKCC
ncbi:unnamed protein product [Ectocarpus sp. 6 AP-2014]